MTGTRLSFRTRVPCPACLLRGYVTAIRVLRWVVLVPGGGAAVVAPDSPNISYCPTCDTPLDRFEVKS